MSDILFDNLVFDRLREIGDQSQRICELESEIDRLRLTDAERAALKTVLRRLREDYFAGRFSDSVEIAAVIDGLLSRLGVGERLKELNNE